MLRVLYGARRALARQGGCEFGGISQQHARQKRMMAASLSSNGFVYFFLFPFAGGLMGADLTTGAGTCAGKKVLFTRTLVR